MTGGSTFICEDASFFDWLIKRSETVRRVAGSLKPTHPHHIPKLLRQSCYVKLQKTQGTSYRPCVHSFLRALPIRAIVQEHGDRIADRRQQNAHRGLLRALLRY